MDWLKSLAPTLATLLGGPFAGLAVEAIGSAFGMSDATQERVKEIVTRGQMTGEQIARLREAETAVKVRLRELDIDLERIAAGDRASARDLQRDTRSRVPGVLAVVVTVGFFGLLYGLMSGWLSVSNSEALSMLIGALSTAWITIVTFYFGSSAGSEQKNALLAKLTPAATSQQARP